MLLNPLGPPSSDPDPGAVSRVAGAGGGFPLSWASDANASQGYVVEWQEATCLHDCPVHWTKVAAERANVSLVSGTHIGSAVAGDASQPCLSTS